MATTGFWPVKNRLKEVIEYARNPDKTIDKKFLDEDLCAALRYVENLSLIHICTMNIMFVNDKKPNPHRCFTEKFGTLQCMLQIRENLMRVHHAEPPEEMITRVLRFGTADIDVEYLKTIIQTAREYVTGIFRRLREHGYDSKLMKLHIVGGGGCMIRNFAEYDESRITVNDDICATAKGYERMLEMKLIKNGGVV